MKKTIIVFIFMFGCSLLHAQILLPDSKVSLPAIINETSGMSWINDSIWVTHNDSGNEPILYFLNERGELKKKVHLKNTFNNDWEDLAYDGENFLYIADMGNNLNNRKDLKIHRYSLADSTEETVAVSYGDQKFPMQESNRNFDSESMVFFEDNLYTFTKNNTTPYNGVCKVYKINFSDSSSVLIPMDSLVLGNEGYWKNSVTAADLSRDKKVLALLTYKYLYLLTDFTGDDFFGGKYMRFLLPEIQQRESVAFDSNNDIWITDENSRLRNGGFLYYYNMDKIELGDFYYKESGVGIVSLKTKKTPEEGMRLLIIQAEVTQSGEYLIEFLKNGKVMKSITKSVEGKIKEEIKFLPDDTYTEVFSVRIYKNNQLLFANKFDPFK